MHAYKSKHSSLHVHIQVQVHLPVSEEDLLEQREFSAGSRDLFPILELDALEELETIALELLTLEVFELEDEESSPCSNITLTLSELTFPPALLPRHW